MHPWIAAEYVLGFLFGLGLGAMAIDHGFQQAKGPAPYVTPTSRSLTTGP